MNRDLLVGSVRRLRVLTGRDVDQHRVGDIFEVAGDSLMTAQDRGSSRDQRVQDRHF